MTITTALLAPPWADTFLILNDNKAGYVRAGTSVFARRRLRRALRESGVTVAHEPPCALRRYPGSASVSTPSAAATASTSASAVAIVSPAPADATNTASASEIGQLER